MADRAAGVLVLSSGRPDRVQTVRTLRRSGYTGPVRVVCDDHEPALGAYREAFGDDLRTFDRDAARARTDEMDNAGPGRVVVYARNAAWEVAAAEGWTHFVVLDDDYSAFSFRFDQRQRFGYWNVTALDEVFAAFFDYLDATPALALAMAQGGDFIGGGASPALQTINARRKAMNVFFLRTDRRFRFPGRLNEDANTYVAEGARGGLFLTIMQAQVVQTNTQQQDGGLTGAYLDAGTYWKSFYSVMLAPSCVKVSAMGGKHWRAHHWINWRKAAPKVLPEKYRRAA